MVQIIEKAVPLNEREINEMKILSKTLGINLEDENDRDDFSKMLREMINVEISENYVKGKNIFF